MVTMGSSLLGIYKFLASTALALALICACLPVSAQVTPPPVTPGTPPPVTGAPESVTGGTGTTSPTPTEIPIQSQVPPPIGLPPQPVATSQPPTGYHTPLEPLPLDDIPGDAVHVQGEDLQVTSTEERASLATAVNATVRYRNTITRAQTASIDLINNIATFQGNVVFRIDDQEVYGDKLTLNLRTREWVLERASTAIEPQFARGYLKAPVFAEGGSIRGLGRREVDAYNAEATTCDLTDPHYKLVARSITIYPERRIILRDTSVYLLGHKVFGFRRLVIPLREIQQNPNLIPRFGQSAEEGFFMKTSYGLLGTATQAGFLLLDLMSKKGVGTGARYNYQLPTGLGQLQVYRLNDRVTDQTMLTGRLDHRQRFGTIQTQLTSNLRDNSYLYAPQSRSINNQLTLTRDVPNANSSLVVSQGIDSVTVQTRRLNGNLTHRQLLGNDMLLDSNFIYNSFGGTSQPSTAQLTSQALLSRSENIYDWTLSAQMISDLSNTDFAGRGRFAGIERLPELALVSDSRRLGRTLPFGLPANYRLSFGQYNELPANTNLGRAYFEIGTPITQHNITNTWALSAGGGFRQFVYSDDTAQYSLDGSATLRKRLGQESTFDLFYRLQQPRGFTPFRFDFIPRYNTLNANLNIRETERFRFSVLTGYNFEQKAFPWQDATLRFSVQPTDNLLFYTATGYDINRSQWRSVINQLRIRVADKFRFDLGTRYDPSLRRFALIRPQLDTQIDRKTRLQAVAGYNGFTRSYDYRSLMLTRDLHCWEASIVYTDQTGFFTDRSLMVYLRIKAFPIFEQFGVGPFGQLQDTSVGQIY